MSIIQAVILGLVQGLTEFLPISSSGHLVMGQKLLGITAPPILFDVLVHLGTLLAVVVFFFKDLLKLTVKKIKLIIIGTIPAIVVGLGLYQIVDAVFNSLVIVASSLIVTALLLLATRWFLAEDQILPKLSNQKALLIGAFQALAILPGVSRSGSTVAAGLFAGLKKSEAFVFSFMLAIPAIVGALALQINDLSQFANDNLTPALVGMGVAAISGLVALKILKLVINRAQLHYFAYYCLFLSLTIFSYLVFTG